MRVIYQNWPTLRPNRWPWTRSKLTSRPGTGMSMRRRSRSWTWMKGHSQWMWCGWWWKKSWSWEVFNTRLFIWISWHTIDWGLGAFVKWIPCRFCNSQHAFIFCPNFSFSCENCIKLYSIETLQYWRSAMLCNLPVHPSYFCNTWKQHTN